jgi:ABC-2 type transport system ATP-binding protein
MTGPHILEVKNLRKVFDQDLFKKKQVVLDDVSLAFPEGSCTALMGHNGAGKTTTIRTIFGLIRPDKGEVLFKGHPLTLEDKRSIGYMPETNKLPGNLTCEEVLSHQLRVFNPKDLKPRHYKEAIEKQLREVGLWEHKKKKVGKLSKGMGRRLSWAQATIHRPELIILDEPMSGLDPIGYKLMVHLIKQLREQGISIVLCTHELWSIKELCDHVHIMKQGKLVFSSLNPPPAQPQKPVLPHFLALSGCSPDSLRVLQEASHLPVWGELRTQSFRTELWFKDYSDAVKWLQACLAKGLIVVDFRKSSGLDAEQLISYFEEDKSA